MSHRLYGIVYTAYRRSCTGKISGNKYTRDNAEDFPSEIDHDSLYVRHEKTHTRRNSNQFGNVTTPLKEYRKSDPTRLKPRAKLDHSMDRRSAQPLGGNTKIKVPAVLSDHSKKATVKKFKKEEFKEEAKKLKAKKILEADKKFKNERRVIKVELPEKIEPGFALDDIIKGKIGFFLPL